MGSYAWPGGGMVFLFTAMMSGEIACHVGEIEAGFDLLREAVATEDRLVYNELCVWMHSLRHVPLCRSGRYMAVIAFCIPTLPMVLPSPSTRMAERDRL